MTILKKIIGTTTLTAVAGTALYFYSDEKTKKKLEPAYESLKKACPYLNCPIFKEDEKSEPSTKDQ
jgi:hypothetical protein|tara:strand:+ start:1988 stop:2185 length:198 start_codon:yes stop_codon:yes gene_type:complete